MFCSMNLTGSDARPFGMSTISRTARRAASNYPKKSDLVSLIAPDGSSKIEIFGLRRGIETAVGASGFIVDGHSISGIPLHPRIAQLNKILQGIVHIPFPAIYMQIEYSNFYASAPRVIAPWIDVLAAALRDSRLCDTAERWDMPRRRRCGRGIRVSTGWLTGPFGYGYFFWRRDL